MPATRESIDVDFDAELERRTDVELERRTDVEVFLSDSDVLDDTSPPKGVAVASIPPVPTGESPEPTMTASPPGVLSPPEAPRRVPASSTIRPPASPAALSPSSRLPPVSPPPFARRPSMPAASELPEASDTLATLPVPMKSPFETTADGRVVSVPPVVAGGSDGYVVPVSPVVAGGPDGRVVPVPPVPAGGSVAPLTLSRAEPPAVVRSDRERARPWRSRGVAAVVAVAVATVTHFAVRTPPAPASVAAPVVEAVPLEPTPVVAPAVVSFGEDEGVTIEVPAAVSASPPAHVPAKPPAPTAAEPVAGSAAVASRAPVAPLSRARNPKVYAPTPMPDGSLGLASKGPASSPVAGQSTIPLPPAGARKRPLTPEQELAEAQLRAAAR